MEAHTSIKYAESWSNSMLNAKQIYESSPPLLQNALVTVSGFIKARQRYGTVYKQHRAWLKDFDTWSLDRATEFQAQQLQEFVRFASQSSDFYKIYYSDIDLDQIKTPADLSILPVLEKETLRSNMDSVYTVGRKGSIEGHTGGTTGKSLVVRYTHTDEMKRMAMLDHFKSRHGFENLKMKKATFSGKHLVSRSKAQSSFWRYNAASKQMLYSTFDISEKNLGFYVESLNKFK